MFGIDSSELFVIGLVALLVIGPSRLPMAMKTVGKWVAKGRAMTRHVRAGFDTMMREAELEEMQKQWAAQNEAIMKATALPDLGIKEALPDLSVPVLSADDWMSPAPEAPAAEPPAPIAEKPAPKPRRKPKAAADLPVEAEPKPARKRAPKAKAAVES
jgi:sec-independent protein translocase protein TatB